MYLSFLLNTILSLSGRGLYFSGMDSHVLRPMITAFCFPIAEKLLVTGRDGQKQPLYNTQVVSDLTPTCKLA